ncbi:NnrS family protein, partial [Achromobacter sp. DMS1]|uniref:NnrS family protein n=1 Tax=Achromobacter sp. DMS1 TaxID=1688405 RepID=UPI002101547E
MPGLGRGAHRLPRARPQCLPGRRAADALFFLWGAAALGRSVWLTRNRRNYGVPLLLAALAGAHAAYLSSAAAGDYLGLMRAFNAGLICMAVLTLLIARRVIPFFAQRAVQAKDPAAHAQRPLAIGGGRRRRRIAAGRAGTGRRRGAGASGLIALAQWLAWKPWAVRR